MFVWFATGTYIVMRLIIVASLIRFNLRNSKNSFVLSLRSGHDRGVVIAAILCCFWHNWRKSRSCSDLQLVDCRQNLEL